MKPAMPLLTRADEAALWSDVEAFLRDEVPAIPLPEQQQDYLLDRFRLSIAELEGLPPAERARVVNVRDRHGNATTGLSHDVQGNLAVRNGLPHVFDFGNRLRSVADKEPYRYDAQGRRIVATAASGTLLSQYTQDGRLVFQQDHRAGGVMHEYLHLGNRLIARRDVGGARPGITYLHTDALGSPVASSNAAGQVVERTHHEPYGAAIGKVVDGPGVYRACDGWAYRAGADAAALLRSGDGAVLVCGASEGICHWPLAVLQLQAIWVARGG